MLDSAVSVDARPVFESIAYCPSVARCLAGDKEHPCYEIVMAQKKRSLEHFQLPEPWVGRIDVVPILFVSSNPSIGKDDHATGSSTREEVWESHHLAFGGGRRTYIIDGVKTTDRFGRPIKTVRYWSSVRARATELMPNGKLRPGTDYALTEVVHCKTEGEYGVARAADTCYELHMDRIWSVAKAA